jgi:hypothetical protein
VNVDISLAPREIFGDPIVRSHCGYRLDELGRRSAAKLLTRDEVRRIAANIAKLPDHSSAMGNEGYCQFALSE